MSGNLFPWDPSKYLVSDEDIAAYLAACSDAEDPLTMVLALGNVARARNMSALARKVGMTREGLYKALSPNGNPSFATISKVATALGYPLRFDATASKTHAPSANANPATARSRQPAEAQRRVLALIDATVATAMQLRESLVEFAIAEVQESDAGDPRRHGNDA